MVIVNGVARSFATTGAGGGSTSDIGAAGFAGSILDDGFKLGGDAGAVLAAGILEITGDTLDGATVGAETAGCLANTFASGFAATAADGLASVAGVVARASNRPVISGSPLYRMSSAPA